MIHVLCVDINEFDEAAFHILYEKASFYRKGRADRYRKQEDALRFRPVLFSGGAAVCPGGS